MLKKKKKIALNLSLLMLIILTGSCFAANNSSGQIKLDKFSNEVVALIITSVDKMDKNDKNNNLREFLSKFYNLKLISRRFYQIVKCKSVQKLFMENCMNNFSNQDFQNLFIQLVRLSAKDLNYTFKFLTSDYDFNENLNQLRLFLRIYKLVMKKFLQLNHNDYVLKVLMKVVENNNIELVKMLINAGVGVNSVYITYETYDNQFETTLLIIASEKGYTELVKILIKAGADVNASTYHSRITALIAAKNDEILNILINHGGVRDAAYFQKIKDRKIDKVIKVVLIGECLIVGYMGISKIVDTIRYFFLR